VEWPAKGLPISYDEVVICRRNELIRRTVMPGSAAPPLYLGECGGIPAQWTPRAACDMEDMHSDGNGPDLMSVAYQLLSTKAERVLRRMHVQDVKALLSLTEDDLLHFPNCGPKTTREIINLQEMVQKSPRHLQEMTRAEPDFEGMLQAKLSARARNVLRKLRAFDRKSLRDLTEEELWNTPDCGDKTVKEILELQRRTAASLPTDNSHNQPAPRIQIRDTSLLHQDQDISEILESELSVRAYKTLQKLRVSDLAGLFALTEDQLLHTRGCGWKTAEEIRDFQCEMAQTLPTELRQLARRARQRDDPAPVATQPVDPNNPYGSLMSWLARICRSQRAREVFALRCGMQGGPPLTLAQVGDIFGITGTRVQQIERRVRKRAAAVDAQAALRPLVERAAKLVKACGGQMTELELTNALLVTGNDGGKLRHATRFIDFLAALPAWCEAGLEKGRVRTNDPTACVKFISSFLLRAAQEYADERIEDDLWSIDWERLKDAIAVRCRHSPEYSHIVRVSDGLIEEALRPLEPSIRRRDDRAYCGPLWRLLFGSRTELVEEILLRCGRPMHQSDILGEVSKWRLNDRVPSLGNVRSWLERSTKTLLWDKGTFVHRYNIEVPNRLLRRIEQRLFDKLQGDIPLYSVYEAFEHHQEKLRRAGLSSPLALYSLLRERADARLSYPRYPTVLLAGKERMSVTAALEEYALEAGGTFELDELRRHATEDLGINETLLSVYLHTYGVPNLVRVGHAAYCHLSYLGTDSRKVRELAEHVAYLLRTTDNISVDLVFRQKAVTCRAAGIRSPEMLYSVLDLDGEGQFEMPGYPMIGRYSTPEARLSMRREVEEFLREKGAPCSIDELEEEFVERRGFKRGLVNAVAESQQVYRYARASMIHADVLEWTAAKQEKIEGIGRQQLKRAFKAGRCYELVEKLMELQGLPSLGAGLAWTRTLLSELLESQERFQVLGNARNAFVESPNEHEIQRFEDLVYRILADEFQGASQLQQFEEFMRTKGIIRKRVTPSMLGDGDRVCIRGKAIMLAELGADA